jgi:beta-aspartyl-peptidase (threonine type)
MLVDIFTRAGLAEVGVLVHGGAGAVEPERRQDHQDGCLAAARAGYAVLAKGGRALDAAMEAARVLEDLPQFNAGTGAALNANGDVEHDAAIMDGESLRAGGVAALRAFKNPVLVARAVMDDGRHVLLCGDGAADLARGRGLAPVDPAALVTDRARQALQKFREGRAAQGWAGGTIGAVARDRQGRLAAATSTGGIVGKLPGRIGDSPIVGAGTLADDASAAVSATGDGEGILRVSLSHRIASAIRHGDSPEDAARSALEVLASRAAASGGAIVIDHAGRYAIARSTITMSWAVATPDAEASGI